MLWPEIPESLSSLSASALRELAKDIKAIALGVLAKPELSADERAEVATYLAHRDAALAEATAKDEDAKRLAALEADDRDDEPVVTEVVAAADVDVVETPAEDDVDAEASDDTEIEAEADASAATVPTSFGVVAKQEQPKTMQPHYLTAVDGVPGRRDGDHFESWRELGLAAAQKASSIRGNTNEKFEVARIKANYAPERVLTDDINFNMSRFEPDELVAALCAPATPYYGVACMNTTRRPVFNSLPQFQAPRMKVSIMPSPTLSDITTGVDVWTAANDADAGAVKEACQTITCGSPTEYTMYGVYRCITIKNMLAMSYPELVEAWLNRLAAAHARLAEQQLLNAMGTGATTVSAPLLGYNATTSIVTTILNYLGLYQESQRWDVTGLMEAWAPRWVLTAMKMDLYRRRTTNGTRPQVMSDAEIETIFREAGVNIHWFIDTPSWATAIPSIGNPLNLLPQAVQILVAPPGKFALMDRGELAIGVTGNGLYRDNTSNSHNQFTFFFENFEGIVNTTSCAAHILDIPVCWTGIQVDDQLVNCLGRDEQGYQS